MPFRKVSLLFQGSSALVMVLTWKLVSVPVGQNSEFRVPFGVVNTTNRTGGVAAWPAARPASSSGMAAVPAARDPRSRFLLVNRRGFMEVISSLSVRSAIPERVGLGHAHDQVHQVAARRGEGALERGQRAAV